MFDEKGQLVPKVIIIFDDVACAVEELFPRIVGKKLYCSTELSVSEPLFMTKENTDVGD